MKTIDLKQKKAAMNECLTVRNGQPFLKLFASETEPLKLLCAYALFCRGKDTTAFSLLEKAGVDKHVLLDISSLHQILRQLHFWGSMDFMTNEISEHPVMPALIPARGNSKGIVRKNLAKLNDKSLLEIAIGKAQKSRYISRVIVDTDCDEITQAARKAGAEVLYIRPELLSGDFSDLSDVRVLATSWLELMEGYWYDYLAVLTPPHPLWLAEELDQASEQFFVSDHTSLVSVTPTEMAWNAYYLLNGKGPEQIARRRSGTLCARNGAFSLFSRKPNGYFNSGTFRKVYPAEFKTMLYPLSKEHGYDINTPDELSMCRKIYQKKNYVTPVSVDAYREYLTRSGMSLPIDGNGPVMLLHYPESVNEYVAEGMPASMKLLRTLSRNAFAGRYAVCGKSCIAKAVAEHFGLPLFVCEAVLERNGALSRHVLHAVGNHFERPFEIVYLNGYGGYLKPETIIRVIDAVRNDDSVFCSALRHSDYPPQWILEKQGDNVAPVTTEYEGFRQKIETTYVESQLLAGFGKKADYEGPFTDHVLLDAQEKIPLVSAINIIEANNMQIKSDKR